VTADATADSDRELDEWSFFTTIAEDAAELRRRVTRKLSMMDVRRKADLIERAGPQIQRLESALRLAHTQAERAAGSRPRTVRHRASSRT
jgi:hypothetical protein